MQIHDVKAARWGLDGMVHVPLFSRDVGVMIEEEGALPFAQKCADYLNSLPDGVIDDLCAASIRYCNAFRDLLGEPRQQFENPRAVLHMVRPSVLIVPVVPEDTDPFVHMELNCDWEIEHGMEWIIREDKPMYVGPFNSEDPMGDFTTKDAWNFA